MKKVLALLTRNRLLGVLAGALTTAVLQSSSATTVMAIGFVSAGLMSLPQAISIIFGANIGTTMTAQIIAFKISDYIYLFVFLGFIITFVTKSEKWKNIGQTIFAFGLLFLGIETMGSVMKPLASSPVFLNLIGKVADVPILGVLVGTLMTLVVQSSSATIAVLQNFATQAGPDGVTSIMGLAGAIPILLGDNIGTTITALLACIGQSKEVFHCSRVVEEMLEKAAEAAKTEEKEILVDIQNKAEIVSYLTEKITDYLADLFSAGVLTEEQATQTARMMYVLGDIERIGSLCREVSGSISDKIEKKYAFTPEAMLELEHSLTLMKKMYSDTLQIMENGETQGAENILKQKEEVLDLDLDMRKAHMGRVAAGKCSGSLTAPFSKILHCIDRIGNSCVNIAEIVVTQLNFNYFLIEKEKK